MSSGKIMVEKHQIYGNLVFGCLAKLVALQVVSTIEVYLEKYTQRHNMLAIMIFIIYDPLTFVITLESQDSLNLL
jgi:hypothetical protein